LISENGYLGALTTDATGELNILGHDCHTLSVDRAQVGVFEQSNEISLSSFLKSKHGSGLKAKIRLEILGNFTDKTLEGSLADEKISGLLVLADLAKGDSSGTVTVGLLHASGSGSGLAGSLLGRGKRKVRIIVVRIAIIAI
jgi:hypothetical protein